VIVEFSPYGRGSGTTQDGPAYNYLLVQIRGTGDSDGRFDALGPRTQQDVAETLAWACHQPWSDGRLGLNGFSASAITVYNSLHLPLACVRTAVLRSGTFELYRDLLWPGGVSNFAPGLGVLGLIGAPAAVQGPTRLQRNPASGLDVAAGLFAAGVQGGLVHTTLDSWWRQRGFRGDVNHLPVLMLDSFFDVESRGAFQAYQALRGDGAHLLVVGAHDGAPTGTDDGNASIKAWFDHYLLGAANGADAGPPVQMLVADGSRESYAAGHYLRYDAGDWPVPGTRWRSLWLAPSGVLAEARAAGTSTRSYAAVPSFSPMTDVPNAGFLGPTGLNRLAAALPPLTETNLTEPLGLTFTTPPLRRALTAIGPAALDLRLSTTAPDTALWAVVADVWPDGTSHPVACGRLSTAYPGIDRAHSLIDSNGDVVQPYGDYSVRRPAVPGAARTYQVELWPIGNRFEAGHRIRLLLIGASGASKPGAPAVVAVRIGGSGASRLLLPVVG
jgi:predicted acyl esterase